MEKDSVSELNLWEEATGCFTLDNKAEEINEQLEQNIEDKSK